MPRKNPSPTSSFTQERKSIVFTPSSASKATSFSCATTRESRFTIAAMNPAPTISNAGASGRRRYGEQSTEQTASHPACSRTPLCRPLPQHIAAEPDAPAFEIVGAGFIAAMVNRDSRVVAQENDVALLADDGVKTIDFLSCVNDDVGDGFFRGI